MMRRFLYWLTSKLDPPRIIYDREGESPYLSRWYVFGAPKASDGQPVFDEYGNPRRGIEWSDRVGPLAVYLHKFHRGDDDGDPHDHPWSWSVAVVLSGGYVEHRLNAERDGLDTRTFRPPSINVIRHDDYHRVDLIEKESWSLFIAGPRASSWGFWDMKRGEHVPWREFIARKRSQSQDEVIES